MTDLASIGVLIIDDQHAARSLSRKILKELQVGQIFEAASGREALSLVESAPEMVNVAVCDWNMPEMSGLEFLHALRAAALEIPVIMATGRADRESVLAARDAGVAGYLAQSIVELVY